jgi:hypothetical protein
MKSIKLPKLARFEIKFDGTVYDTHKIRENHEAFSQNVRKVIFSAATIEHMLKDFVTNFFVTEQAKREFFQNIVILSDSFSFRHAMRAVLAILESNEAMSKEELKNLKELLFKVMAYRNALTHGHTLQKEDKLFCRYYNNRPCEDEINDAYWQSVEDTFHRAFDIVKKLA